MFEVVFSDVFSDDFLVSSESVVVSFSESSDGFVVLKTSFILQIKLYLFITLSVQFGYVVYAVAVSVDVGDDDRLFVEHFDAFGNILDGKKLFVIVYPIFCIFFLKLFLFVVLYIG